MILGSDDDPGGLPPAHLGVPRDADAAVLRQALEEARVPTALLPRLDGSATDGAASPIPAERMGCLVLTQEMLTDPFRAAMAALLDAQPAWSELPVVVILEQGEPGPRWSDVLIRDWPRAQVSFLFRPLTALEMQSAVQLALGVRLRQFRIRDQLSREKELRRELNHRVKNIFATVQAVANLTRRTANGADPFALFDERLAALGRVHGTLERVGGTGETFETLARTVLAPFLADGAEKFSIAGPPDALDPSACNLLGLCLFEFATNAVKHGAPSVPEGRVAIELAVEEDGVARLSWTERHGPPVRQPTRRGYGTRFLVMTLTSIFGEAPELLYDPEGFRMTVEGRPRSLFAADTAT